jgi:hypothetical protein
MNIFFSIIKYLLYIYLCKLCFFDIFLYDYRIKIMIVNINLLLCNI